MQTPTYLEKLQTAPATSFHVLDPVKAKRMNVKTLFIPSPQDVARVIKAVPEEPTRTIVDLRRELATAGNAETSCPAATIKYWKWLAYASEEARQKDPRYLAPWWRVLKYGKPSRHMPGGVENQIVFLRAEGVQIDKKTNNPKGK